MGNICGKTESDNFSSPGRTVGALPEDASAPKTAPVPRTVGGPPRTLGGTSNNTAPTPAAAGGDDDPRRRAAEAAEARLKAANKPGGKLQTQLTAQKKQTRSDTLQEASHEEVRTRDADEAAQARNWD